MNKTAQQIVERWGELRTARQPYEQQWQQIAQYIRPVREEFRSVYYSGELPPGSAPQITDSTAFVALDNFAGGLYGFLSNSANVWFTIESFDDDLNDFHAVKDWNADVSRVLLNSFSPAVSAFYNQAPEVYADTPAFGTGGFFSEWRAGEGQIFDKCYSPFEIYLDVNNYGEVDAIYRPFYFTPRQALQKWRPDRLSARIKADADKGASTRSLFLHVVHPNEDFTPGMFGPERFAFVDVYVEAEDPHEVQRGGRYELPYQAPRWSGTQTYGYGLGRRNLPDTKTINSMKLSVLERAEWLNHPPILLPDEDTIQTVRPVPRKPVYGGMSPSGRPLASFLVPDGNLPVSFELLNAEKEQLRDAFYFSLMQLVGRTGMTATEILERQEEKMRLMGPHLARLQAEFLAPAIKLRFAMLWRAGRIPPPPRELQGQQLKIEYVSPMARAQRAGEAQAVVRLIDATVAMMQVDPTAGDNIDVDEAVKVMQTGFGAPVGVLRSPEERDAIRKQRQQVQQAAQAAEIGQMGADAMQKLSSIVPRNNGMAQ